MASTYTTDGEIKLLILQEDSEQILNIIKQCVGHELRQKGINDIIAVDTSDIDVEHTAAVEAINHHHDVLYQRGVNSGLKGVNQLGEGQIMRFEIEGGADVLKRIVVLIEACAKISLHKETGLRGAVPPSTGHVYGTSKKMEEGALVAALDDYWTALRKNVWEMVEEKKDGGGEEGDAGEALAVVKKEERDPEDMTSSSEDDR